MIPGYQELMRPVLECARHSERKISDVVSEISELFDLTYEEKAELLPSGKQTKIANRTAWARSYLKQAGLVHNNRRGWYQLTERGQQVLEDPSIQLSAKYLEKFTEFREFQSRSADNGEVENTPTLSDSATPDENLLLAHERLNEALATNLLNAVRNVSPEYFEQVIVDLFIAMGYGGTSRSAGRALGKSGDNGVDGVIDQDPLGVDQIYLQAKRYDAKNSVGASDIRDFFGALNLKRATKGIFVTTSYFTDAAFQTAENLGSRLVLIDGEKLARLLIQYNIGCEQKSVLLVKELDESYFDDNL